jgi:hypothetical protein
MDSYLKPIEDALGPHKGLNADWCVMAWPIRPDLWLLDDESCEETVSLVSLSYDAEGEPTTKQLLDGLVKDVLPAALRLRAA